METTSKRGLLALGALLCALPLVPAPLALGLGLLVSLLVPHGEEARLQKLTPRLLALVVIGLGAGIDLREVAEVGLEGASLTLLTITLCLGVGLLLARALRVPTRLGLLIAVGTAICGGSAIATVAPVLRAKDDETSIALSTIFLLNASALLVLPLVGHALGMDAERFGVYAALAVHDTSSVIGAAMSFGERAVEIATTVKLARAMWIVPLALVLGTFVTPRLVDAGDLREKAQRPWFILGFLGLAALVTCVPALGGVGEQVASLSRRLMGSTLFLIGAGVSRASLARAGLRPLALATTLWLVVALCSLLLVGLP